LGEGARGYGRCEGHKVYARLIHNLSILLCGSRMPLADSSAMLVTLDYNNDEGLFYKALWRVIVHVSITDGASERGRLAHSR
jgi:hypothetical protein